METNAAFYFTRLYPLQDDVLRVIGTCNTEFYLTGGTAVSRGLLNHRFSDDLDLFVNYATVRDTDPRYGLWRDHVIEALRNHGEWQIETPSLQIYYTRILVHRANATHDDWAAVRWITPPDPEAYLNDLIAIGESLILP
jgi:hypothetical protein